MRGFFILYKESVSSFHHVFNFEIYFCQCNTSRDMVKVGGWGLGIWKGVEWRVGREVCGGRMWARLLNPVRYVGVGCGLGC